MLDLQKWQGGLVESLLHEDPRFRIEYAQDPEAACRARGFAFRVDAASNEGWIRHDRETRVAAYARPS